MNPAIIQAIGYVALVFVLLSFQKNKRSTLLALMVTEVFILISVAVGIVRFDLLRRPIHK